MSVTWKDFIFSLIYGPLIIIQFILMFLYYNHLGIYPLLYIGWIIWGFSIVFGFLPMYTLKKKGGVQKGKSYVHTTKLVDTGIYSIVRHPQHLSGLLLIVSLALLSQHWLSIIAGTIAFLTLYIDILRADTGCIKKFGEDYKYYMKRVPRFNFILGIFRKLRKA